MKRKFASFVIYLLIFSSFLFPISAMAEDLADTASAIDSSVKIYDYADLLDDSQEATLSEMAIDLAERQQTDIAVVTINDAEGKSSMEYADDFYDYNGFGYGGDRSGLLMLINMEVREVWISTHGEAISLFTASDIDTLTGTIYNYLSTADYAGACTAFLEKSDEHITNTQLALETSDGSTSTDENTSITHSTPVNRPVERRGGEWLPFRERYSVIQILLASLGIGFAFAIVVLLGMVFSHKRSLSPAPGVQTYLTGKGLVLTHQEDRFLHTHTTRTAIPKQNNNSGGGSGGGGGSTHTSSSGSTHGGGGRSF